MTLIRELIEIPTQVHDGDFVLKLTQGISGDTQATVDQYVVTKQIAEAFDKALKVVASAVGDNQSKATYLQGSFGSGKSHFMAMLHLLLSQDTYARSKPELHGPISEHADDLDGKSFLLVPVHFLGAQSMEQKILGGYVDTVQRLHPDEPLPAVWVGDTIVATELPKLRATLGDEAFVKALNQVVNDDEFGEYGSKWTSDSVDAALEAPATDPQRQDLVTAYIATFRESTVLETATSGKGYLDLDRGLAAISTHASNLGYAGVVLFLDELILWLASNIGDLDFVEREGQKLTILVESTHARRPIPIVSFVARQRDLRDLVGDHVVGAEERALADTLELQHGRFEPIELSSGNLPLVAKQRLLKPNNDDAAAELSTAVDQALGNRDDVRRTLLGSDADIELFRTVYPFSPTLVHALVDVSEALQRERTALKVMLQLLVDHRDELEVGDIIPVGDLWDVVVSRDEPFSSELKTLFETAKKLWRTKLEPALRSINQVTADTPDDAPERRTLARDSRLVKTILLAALVPEVEAFRGLDAQRIAALNWGNVNTPIAGNETQIVAGKLRRLVQGGVGELLLGDDPVNPTVTLRLANVDTEDIIKRAAESYDNASTRRSKIRELIARSVDGRIATDLRSTLQHDWRGTKRELDVIFGNVRDTSEVPDNFLVADNGRPKLVIDFPFDQSNRSPEDDLERLDAWREQHPETSTVCWLPSFFSAEGLTVLGRYVACDEVLKSERFEQHTAHLSQNQRVEARPLIEATRNQLAEGLREAILVAYGVKPGPNPLVDSTHALTDHYRSLDPTIVVRPTTQPNFDDAVEQICDQIFDSLYPGHPKFDSMLKPNMLKVTWEQIQHVLADPNGRAVVASTNDRTHVRTVANALKLGTMHESHFTLDDYWRSQLARHLPANPQAGEYATVSEMRAWIDATDGPRGLESRVADLIILTVAAQTDHRLVEGAQTFVSDGSGAMPGSVELVPEQLPDPDTWTSAAHRAAVLFGITVHPRCTGPELASLGRQVRDKVNPLVQPAQGLAEALGDAYGVWGLPDGNRLATARTSRNLVNELAAAADTEIVTLLDTFNAPTSDEAAAKSLSTANVVAAALRRANLQLWKAAGEVVKADADEALTNDELVTAFEPAESAIEASATAAVAGQQQPPQPPPEPPPSSGVAVQRRRVEADEQLDELVDTLRDEFGEHGPLTITWTPDAD